MDPCEVDLWILCGQLGGDGADVQLPGEAGNACELSEEFLEFAEGDISPCVEVDGVEPLNGTTAEALSHEFDLPLVIFYFRCGHPTFCFPNEVGGGDVVQPLVVVEGERSEDCVCGGHDDDGSSEVE